MAGCIDCHKAVAMGFLVARPSPHEEAVGLFALAHVGLPRALDAQQRGGGAGAAAASVTAAVAGVSFAVGGPREGYGEAWWPGRVEGMATGGCSAAAMANGSHAASSAPHAC